MRIAIREQLAALVIFAVLVSLAVISIPTWMFVNRFVVDIESRGMALTASLKAAQIVSELELLQTSLQTVSTRRSIQDALIDLYRGESTFGKGEDVGCETESAASPWCNVEKDIGRTLESARYTNLLQARIYLNDTYEGYSTDGVINLSSPDANTLLEDRQGDPDVSVDEGDVYYDVLFPDLKYTIVNSTRPVTFENGTTIEESFNQTVAEPFEDVTITSAAGLVLGPLVINETFSIISLTGPIYDNGTESAILGYLTLVATAKSLIDIQRKTEGLDESGVVLIVGPTTPYNKFPADNPVTTPTTDGDKGRLAAADVHFVLPPITPQNGDERHPDRKFDGTAEYSTPFTLEHYPAALAVFSDKTNTKNYAGSMLSTNNEEGYDVAVGFARPDTHLVNWTVIVEKSREEAYIPVVTLRHILLGCVFGTAGVSLLLVYPAAHRFVMPIRRLKAATERSIAPPGYDDTFDSFDFDDRNDTGAAALSQKSRRGFFAKLKRMTRRQRRRSSAAEDDHETRRRIFKIPAKVEDRKHLVTDELTELTRTFNEMTDELYKQYTQLEVKVAERTRELEISKKAAEAANESKTLFIANISHELKTPLNGIMGMTSICLEETDKDKIHDSLKTIYKSGDLLLHLLTDLLSFSKNQIGQQLSLDEKEFRLSDIRQQILVIFDKQVREGDIDFNVRFLSSDEEAAKRLELPPVATTAFGPIGTGRLKDMCLWGDQHRILQVIINLVSNSLKFTPRGGKVDCRIRCIGEAEAYMNVSRQSSTSKNGVDHRTARVRHRVGSASNNSGGSRATAVDSSQFPIKEGTAVVINPIEPLIAPSVAPIRERSPSPPPRDLKNFLFEFEVEDSGPGIPDHMQQKVFEPFVQGDLGLSRKHGGTGLGLSICQQLATLMGGSITLKSTMGVGTAFTMRIPLRYIRNRPSSTSSSRAPSIKEPIDRAPSPQSQPSSPLPTKETPADKSPADALSTKPRLVGLSQPFFAANADPSPSSARDDPIDALQTPGSVATPGSISAMLDDKGDPIKLRVLVAEDNSTNIQVLRGFLGRESIVGSVVIARDGQEAYERVKASMDTDEAFDLILMDIQMPLMDGLQSTRLIRKAGYSAPIVALSAFSEDSNVKDCLEVGMNDFMGKPLSRQTLRAMLHRFAPIPEEVEPAEMFPPPTYWTKAQEEQATRPTYERKNAGSTEKSGSTTATMTTTATTKVEMDNTNTVADNYATRNRPATAASEPPATPAEKPESKQAGSPEGRTSSNSSHTVVTPSDTNNMTANGSAHTPAPSDTARGSP